MKKRTSAGTGANTTSPISNAVRSARGGRRPGATSRTAPMYDAVSSGVPAQRISVWVVSERPADTWSIAAIDRPSASDGQKRCP